MMIMTGATSAALANTPAYCAGDQGRWVFSLTSTMIRAIGYDAETKSLEIEFNKGGATWLYSEFPPEEYEALIGGGSVGKFFLARIKDKYPATKL